jgi:hypothetical protein
MMQSMFSSAKWSNVQAEPRRIQDVDRDSGIPKALARENFRSSGPVGCTPSGPLKVPMPFVGIACSELFGVFIFCHD